MADRPPSSINPHAGPDFRISPTDRIASAGSCFAQRISEALRARGYNYLITEEGPPFTTPEAREALGYGVYSARYGNLYTALQLLQLFERAFGEFEPQEPLWTNANGRFVDPFRSGVQPRGFDTETACQWDRRSHLKAAKRVFEEADVFTFTLGLTESWLSAVDGAVFPNAPGSGLGGQYDPDRHVFHNFTVAEVVDHLDRFIVKLAKVNPNVRIILTVSPVPLIATFEPRHVLQSTVYSKSVLRVACDEIIRRHPHVSYFASYEIVTATGDSASAFLADRRAVSDATVDHVIDCFAQQYIGADFSPVVSGPATTAAPELASHKSPMCDEDEILKALASQSAADTPA
jgi:hypothetical protein